MNRTRARPNGLARFRLPVPDWIRDYHREWIALDVAAGLTAAAVVIPKAMAYATIAGLPVQVGLYTAFVPMVIYAALGTSRPLSVSTTTTLAILAAAALGEVAPGGDPASLLTASATLTLLVGAILVLASLLRLGFVANFISEPVLVGFKAGIGLVIVLDQVPKLLGIHIDKGSFVHNVLAIARGIPDGLDGDRRRRSGDHRDTRSGRAPSSARARAADRGGRAGSPPRVFSACSLRHGTVGQVPTGLPSLTMPRLALIAALWPAALGIALMSFTETIAAGRAFAASGEPTPHANRELLATGLANAEARFSAPCRPAAAPRRRRSTAWRGRAHSWRSSSRLRPRW